MPERPVVTIVHELPGRVRMRLSCSPKEFRRMQASVKEHAGILSVEYSPVTRSVLVRFNPKEVTREEIVIRLGLVLSLDYGAVPVQVLSRPEVQEMSASTFYSGLLLVMALGGRLVRRETKSRMILDWLAGLGTTWAILDHGWTEVQRRGNFDPEGLSGVYLLTALVRGNFLPAALFTWFTTFGRHLVQLPSMGVELQPIEVANKKDDEHPYYEVVVSPVRAGSDRTKLFTLLPAMVKYVSTGGGGAARGNLMDEIRKVSQLHGKVLEGLGELRRGIPLRMP